MNSLSYPWESLGGRNSYKMFGRVEWNGMKWNESKLR